MVNHLQTKLLFLILGIVLIQSSIVPDQTFTNSIENNDGNLQLQKNIYKPKEQRQWTFDDYEKNYSPIYTSETQRRNKKSAFDQNMKKLKQNSCSPCGVTSMFDKAQQQLNSLKGFLFGRGDESKNNQKYKNKRFLQILQSTSPIAPPLSFDWRKYNVITPVKNQKLCGSCWAYCTTAFFESQLIRRNQATLVLDLAQQFLLQCDLGSFGCQGGGLNTPIKLLLTTGIPREQIYPYNPEKIYQGICGNFDYNYKLNGASNIIFYSSRYTKLSDDQIIQLLLQRPLMIAINADDWTFYKPTDNDRTMRCIYGNSITASTLNHAALLVGYTEKQWIIKNSWGNGYGVSGYIYVTREANFNCGIGLVISTLDYSLPTPKF